MSNLSPLRPRGNLRLLKNPKPIPKPWHAKNEFHLRLISIGGQRKLILDNKYFRNFLGERALANATLFKSHLVDSKDILKRELNIHKSLIGLGNYLHTLGALPLTVSTILEVLESTK